MSHLVLNPAVLLAASPDGYLAYDVDRNRLHRLNPTAALLVELCDGTRSNEQVLAAVAPLLPGDSAAACAAWLKQAVAQRLLIAKDAVKPKEPWTAADLGKRAARLRSQDCVLAAFICQQHAAELAPDDPKAWYALGELAHIVGRRDEARAAYERYQRAHPEDVEVEHLLIALRNDAPPQRASDRYIKQLYHQFAAYYDDNMCGDLDYRAPELLDAALRSALGMRKGLRMLELGCGTGLFGQRVRPWLTHLAGIDLSDAMIEKARKRGIYDHLEMAEITAWLTRPPLERFDVIAICDSLIYFGDLRQVLPGAARLLAPGGLLGFTVEQGATFPYHLSDSGRFTHHRDHLLEVAQEAGLRVFSQTSEVLRYEYGEAVAGLVSVLKCGRPASSTDAPAMAATTFQKSQEKRCSNPPETA